MTAGSPDIPARAELSWQSCPGSSVLAVLSWQFCPGSLFLPVLLCMSRSACPVCLSPPVQFGLSCLPVPFCLSRSPFHVLPVLFCLPISACPVGLCCSAYRLFCFLFWLSLSAFPVLPVPFWISCSACPGLPVPFYLSCPGFPVLAFLSLLYIHMKVKRNWDLHRATSSSSSLGTSFIHLHLPSGRWSDTAEESHGACGCTFRLQSRLLWLEILIVQ